MTSFESHLKILPDGSTAERYAKFHDKIKNTEQKDKWPYYEFMIWILSESYENFGVEMMAWIKPHYSREKLDEKMLINVSSLDSNSYVFDYTTEHFSTRARIKKYLLTHIKTAVEESKYSLDIEKKFAEYPTAPVVKKFDFHYFMHNQKKVPHDALLIAQLQWIEGNRIMIKASEVVPVGMQTKVFPSEAQKWYTEQFEEGKRLKIELVDKWPYYERIIWVLSRSYRDFADEIMTWMRTNYPDKEFESKVHYSQIYDKPTRLMYEKVIYDPLRLDEVKAVLQGCGRQIFDYVILHAKHVFATRKPDFESFFSRYPMCPILKSFDTNHHHEIGSVCLLFQLEWMRTSGVELPKKIDPPQDAEHLERLVKNIIHNAANLMGAITKK